ncbi:MAG TPA: hypothetical protein VFT74_03115, partial [Isosphaeraceae bacterium]|nr:hypothetical protein [Isosphaeraceae bacterium]
MMIQAVRLVASVLAVSLFGAAANAQDQALSRYIPQKNLALYVEFDGLKNHQAEWDRTSMARMLSKTSLGPMLQTILVQTIDRASENGRRIPFRGQEIVGLLQHVLTHGFAAGVCGQFDQPGVPPEAM